MPRAGRTASQQLPAYHHPTIQIELDGIDDLRPAGAAQFVRRPLSLERRARKRSSAAAPKARRSPLRQPGPPVCTPLSRSSSRKLRIDRRSAMLAAEYISPRRPRAWAWRSRTAGCQRDVGGDHQVARPTWIDDRCGGRTSKPAGTWTARMKRDGGVRNMRLATRGC